jgi:cell shape-determining protein MreC
MYNNFTIMKAKNIREIFEDYLFTNGITKISVAKKLKLSQQNFQKKTAKNNYDSEFIIQISTALKHDFFLDLSLELNKLPDMKDNLLNNLRLATMPDNTIINQYDKIQETITENRIKKLEKEILDNSKDKKQIRNELKQQTELLQDVLSHIESNKKNKDVGNVVIPRKAKLEKK